ncbi:MAG: pentapeptide repeat-containing protein [Myxococcales bacterium]|nr:pentapeptide repeat-containing protein [Myxococcales bacterium]
MAAVGALLGVGLLGTLLFLFRRQLFRGTLGSLPAVYAPIPELVAHLKAGDQAAAAEAATLVGQRFVAWWGWISLRNWIIRALIGVVAGFAALLGSVLLWEQNQLVARQNALIEAQNAYFQRQVGQDSDQWSELRLSQLRTTLVEVDCREGGRCKPVAGPVARGQALAALATLERQAGRLPLELHGLDLKRVDLRGADLSGVRLVDSDLRGALLDGARLVDARFTGSDLTGVSLRGAWVDGPDWLSSVAEGRSAVAELSQSEWTVCRSPSGWRVQAAFPGCEGKLVTARPTAAVREGKVKLGPAASDVARVPLDGPPSRLDCSTLGEALTCELIHDGVEYATRLHWGRERLVLEPVGDRWAAVGIEVPAAMYTKLRLDRFNR